MINETYEYVDGVISIQCRHCGKWPEVERKSAFFCDDKCRNAYHYALRKRAKDIAQAFNSLETLIQNMPKKGNSPEWDALIKMKTIIDNAMWNVEN